MDQPYQPINCHFYDELELLAVRKQACTIIYHTPEGQLLDRTDTILDFKIIERAEYLLLKSGEKIRLDRIVSVDGKELKGFC
ncbi:MAG: hypothetical protein AAF960_08070 [Bacteroidota bacterium]